MKKVLLIAALAACGKSGGDDHWKSWPTETVKSTVDGVAFQIDLPKGMRMKEEGQDVAFDIHQNDRVYTPDIMITVYNHASKLDEYLKTQTGTMTRQEQVGDGFIVSGENDAYPGKQDFLVHTELPIAGGKALICDGRVTPFRPGDNVKADMLPLVEKMCLSLKPS